MHHSIDRIAHTTAFVKPVGENDGIVGNEKADLALNFLRTRLGIPYSENNYSNTGVPNRF